jgi:hypothetical protein
MEHEIDLYVNRDARTAADVSVMAELGRFGDQFIVYGTATKMPDGKILYWVTGDEKKLYKHVDEKRLEELYCTPVVSYHKRMQMPSGMEESLLLASKYALMSEMKKAYEGVEYFTLMEPFFLTEANNNSYPVLCAYQESIDGNFDDLELQLFTGVVQMAYERKILDFAHYQELMSWHHKVRLQMSDDPIVADNLGRTLYGFVYWKNGIPDAIFDAQEISVIRQRVEKQLQGCWVGPVVKKEYWFQQFQQFRIIRDTHREWLLRNQDDSFYNLLQKIMHLPGVIEADALHSVKNAVKHSAKAMRAVEYYDRQWNKVP